MDDKTTITSGNLHAALLKLRDELDNAMLKDWQRSLPMAELLNDRWQRAKKLGFADGASIYASSLVYGNVEVGTKSWVGPYTILDGSGGKISVGAYCNLSVGTQLYTHDSVHWCLSGGKAEAKKGDIKVGDCTYIGPNCVIQSGVDVGDHTVIGANSLVNRDIPAFSFAYGNPCRVQGKIIEDAKGNFAIEPLTRSEIEEA